MKKIETMITAFRDGFQSVYGARVFTQDFLPAVAATRAAGITHFEAGGGARFQAPFFYCNENAFDSMDAFRRVTGPDANLQTLACAAFQKTWHDHHSQLRCAQRREQPDLLGTLHS
jgi:pyruvate carboxylase subunit B